MLYRNVLDAAREAEGFVSVTRDKEEITLIVAQSFWEQLAPQFPQAERNDTEQKIGVELDTDRP